MAHAMHDFGILQMLTANSTKQCREGCEETLCTARTKTKKHGGFPVLSWTMQPRRYNTSHEKTEGPAFAGEGGVDHRGREAIGAGVGAGDGEGRGGCGDHVQPL